MTNAITDLQATGSMEREVIAIFFVIPISDIDYRNANNVYTYMYLSTFICLSMETSIGNSTMPYKYITTYNYECFGYTPFSTNK